MSPLRGFALGITLSATLALAGCTTKFAGSPLADKTGASSNPPTTTSTETSSGRPRNIDLDDKDPCGLIPQSDWSKFGIEGPGQRSEEPNLKSPHCYYSSVGDITLVVTEDIGAWDERGQDAEISDAEAIEGFPAIMIWNQVDERSCYTAVDVSDGQYLLTTAMSIEAQANRTATCELSYELAKSAMKTLAA
ncbi:DUF3558 domain-containing protein [Actinophytocola sp.]|uniref:DUF3558 domain-containing protein n=1 Tax=Actinophytocola sp. TaxID=1872138 RepID=UPI002ED12CFF